MQSHWYRWGREISQRLKSRILPKSEYDKALKAREQTEELIRKVDPEANIYLEGSIVTTGLIENGSDLDMCCCSPKYGSVPDAITQKKFSEKIYRRLKSTTPHWSNFQLIDMVRIPLIKHETEFDSISTVSDTSFKPTTILFRMNSSITEQQYHKLLDKIDSTNVEKHWLETDTSESRIYIRTDSSTSAVRVLGAQLNENSIFSNEIKIERDIEDRASVPEFLRFPFDITFLGYAVRNSYLIREYLMDPGGPKSSRLCQMAIKRWGKITEVGVGAKGNLTSYALTIMWIYFLLRTGQVGWTDPWSIPEALHLPRYPNYSPFPQSDEIDYAEIGEQLYEFFNFYSKINYNSEVISLSRPGITTRETIDWLTMQKEKFHFNMCLEDPYEDDLNCARRMNSKKLAWFKELLDQAMSSLRGPPRISVNTLIGGR